LSKAGDMTDAVLEPRSHCPVCGGTATGQLVDLSFDDGPIAAHLRRFYEGRLDPTRLRAYRFQLEQCHDCGLIYQRYAPSGPFLDELYGEIAVGDQTMIGRQRGLLARQAYAYDVEQLIKYHGREPWELNVLDFGAGYGFWLEMASAYGCEVSAAEFSTMKAGRLERRGWNVLPATDLPSDTFHFINTEQVFEHLTDPADTVRRLATALRPGGLLRISVPNGSNVVELLQEPDWLAAKGTPRSLNAVTPLEHLNCYTRATILRLGGEGGLEEFRYPLRQFLDPMERIRFAASAFVHVVRKPQGTLALFRKP
jgi:SAM-dependent methyltransferase